MTRDEFRQQLWMATAARKGEGRDEYNKTFTFRLPELIFNEIRAKAALKHTTVTAYVIAAIIDAIIKDEFKEVKP